jgi:hypothetical protein
MSNQETSEKLHNIIKQQELLQQQQANLKAQEDALKKELASLQQIEKDERQQTITQYVQNWIQHYIQNHDLKGYNFEYNPTKMTIYYYNDKQSITAVCESFKNNTLETVSTKLEKLSQILQPYHVVYNYVTHVQKYLSEQFFIDDNNPYIEYDKETNQYKIKLTVYSYKEDVTRTCSNTIELSIAYVNGIVNMSILYIPDSYNKHRSIIRIDDHTLLKIEANGPYDSHDIYLTSIVSGSLDNFYPLLYQTISELDDRFAKITEV